MTDTTAPILPCPFCGGDPKHSDFIGNGFTMARVRFTEVSCRKCFITTGPVQPFSDDRAIARWNTRSDLHAAAEARARESALDALAAYGQAHEAYAAQQAAEAERDALRAQLATARADALEEAAKVADAAKDKRNAQRKQYPDDQTQVMRWTAGALQADLLAAAIRALKGDA